MRMLAAVLLLLATSAAAETVVVPLDKPHAAGLLVVTASVNGRPVHLLVDTGATTTLLAREVIGGSVAGTSFFANAGFVAQVRFYPVDLRLESREWPKRMVAAADLTQIHRALGKEIDGVLGQDLLREFTSMQIDYKARTLTLTHE